ncbi:MAG: ABC transporter permease subunit [Thermoplasmata archaeon]|nr:ABC transporter permease subunit [Thermoplasmata archaeon]
MDRVLPIAGASVRASLRGVRLIGLAALGSIPTLVVLAIVAARSPASSVHDAAQLLFVSLTLPIVMTLVTLVLGVAQFRGEIEDDTLAYLTSRSVPRALVAVGKYLGCVAAGCVILLPTAMLPLAVADAAGAGPPSSEATIAIASAVVLGVLAYSAIFLLLGLLSSSALILGLIFGFLWEGLLQLLSGTLPRLTVAYYLHSLVSLETPGGPMSGYTTVFSSGEAVAVLLGVALGMLLMTAAVFRYAETAPHRSSA